MNFYHKQPRTPLEVVMGLGLHLILGLILGLIAAIAFEHLQRPF